MGRKPSDYPKAYTTASTGIGGVPVAQRSIWIAIYPQEGCWLKSRPDWSWVKTHITEAHLIAYGWIAEPYSEESHGPLP